MREFLAGGGLELCYLLAGVLVALISLSFGRRADSQKLFIVGAVMGSVISLAAIASLIEFSRNERGEVNASFRRTTAELQAKTDRLKIITDDLDTKNNQLQEITKNISRITLELTRTTGKLDRVVEERTRSEQLINGRLGTVVSQIRLFENKFNEITNKVGSAPVQIPSSSPKALIALIASPSAIEDARNIKDKLASRGFAVAVRPTDLSDRERKYPSGTINLVYLKADEPSAHQVQTLIRDSGLSSRLRNFQEVHDLTYEPVQVVLW